VNGAAAHLPAVFDGLQRLGLLGFGLAVRRRLDARVVGERGLEGVLDLVVGEVLLAQVWALFEHHDTETRNREFLGDDAARRAGADDEEVHRFGRPVARRAHLGPAFIASAS
jgi:hypothetical protein